MKYAIEGWNILSSYLKVGFLVGLVSSAIFLELNNPIVIRYWYLLPIVLTVCTVLGYLIKKFEFFRDNLFIFVLILQGYVVINGNQKASKYSLYEFWICYCYLSQFVSIYMCLWWKKMILAHWLIVFYFLVTITQYHSEVPITLYLAFIFGSWIFTLTILLNAKQIKEILLLIKEKRDLVHTIQTILRAFPEGVIIRSLDQTSKSVISKFSNDVYDDQIRKEEQEVIILRKDEDEEQNITLEDFLCMQEDEVIKHSNEESHIAEQLVQIKKRIRHFESENTTFDELTDFSSFNVKTVLTFIHLF